MDHDRDVTLGDSLLDGGAVLGCTLATMDMLRHALAVTLGADEADDYGLSALPSADPPDTGGDAARPTE